MAGNPNASELLTLTLRNYQTTLADNISLHGDVLRRMKQRGNMESFSGGPKIVEQLEYDENSTVKWMSGYETVDLTPQDLFTYAEYDIKQLVGAITISGLEELINAGKEKLMPLMARRLKNLETSMGNTMITSLFSDGTGTNGKQLTGFKAMVSTTPTLGTLGNISRVTNTWWRNQKFDGTNDGSAAVSATNIQDFLLRLNLLLIRNSDYADLQVMDIAHYRMYTNSLTPLQRVTGNDTMGSGFKSLKFYGVGHESDVVFSGNGTGQLASSTYPINTKYLRYRPHADRDMQVIGGERQPVNQDATIKLVAWAGNLTNSNPSLQGVLFN